MEEHNSADSSSCYSMVVGMSLKNENRQHKALNLDSFCKKPMHLTDFKSK